MKNALKKIINLSLIFMFLGIICMLETLGASAPSVSPSFLNKSAKALNNGLEKTSINDSLFFIDLSIIRVDENYIYVYDNSDSTIKIIDKQTNTYREINNHYRFSNLKDMIIYKDALILLDSISCNFTCINKNTFEPISFLTQENLASKETLKAIKILTINSKDYLLLCPSDPTTGYFELAELSLETVNLTGTQTEKVLTISNIKSFKIAENWADNLNSYKQIFVSEIENELFIMLLTDDNLYSFFVNPLSMLSVYQTITSVSGIDSVENILDIKKISLFNTTNDILVSYSNKIEFYNLSVEKNITADLVKRDMEISLDDFPISSVDSNESTIAVLSGEKQAVKLINYTGNPGNQFSYKTIVNEQLYTFEYSLSAFKYIKTVQETNLLSLPYSREPISVIPENTNLVIIGEGRYSTGELVFGWYYVLYSVNNQNYYGFIDSISCNDLIETEYDRNYVTVLGYTKLYSLPSKFLDNKNTEIKTIVSSSRLEVLSSICDYNSANTEYLLVKVNGDQVGFIDKSRVLKAVSINDKIIPDATVMRNNSEIFTSTDENKEIIMHLDKGARVKVIGKRDTVTNYTKVSFNDSEGNEYTGYIYTYNLEPDSWSTLQIIGMFLVAINVILLVVIICIKNKVTR